MKNINIKRFQLPAVGALMVLVFAALTYWAGFPREKFSIFVLGATILIGGMALYGLVVWHLLLRPLPAGVNKPALAMQPVPSRRLQAVLVTIAGMGIVIGGFWDEVWHRSFGFPFGPDLFWRPHILIYLGLLTPPLLAVYSLYTLLKKGKGSLQQRFRADPVNGLIILAGCFLIYTVPADPIWHTIYGKDISAWSLPHIMLLFSVSLIMILAVYIQLTTLPERHGSSLRKIKVPELLVLVALSFAILIQLQVLATDWENGNRMLANRPDWLLPVIFASLSTLMGSLVIRSLRRWGAATVIGLIAVLIRFGLIEASGYSAITARTWLPILPPLVALDLWYAIRIHLLRNRAGEIPLLHSSLSNGLASLVGMAVSLRIIARTFTYPVISWPGVVGMGLASLVASILGSWIGFWLSDSLFQAKSLEDKEYKPGIALRLASPAVFSIVVVFIVFFIVTAIPPA